ncbi:hypothetical protein H261_11854 [Paramagnetospirillum caucaseum]|uniref:Uncharacterized protein n=1 Tax=Paramagnetospirillum caucaseum TaxID=1244869 RepID=M2ZQY1_9PROT|nr:DUF1804 family protein [Paramagnetospirillum caucaseum]EME69727.1 hypothetical protein H261_11854 [Paramagnetospirillum caucaseum]
MAHPPEAKAAIRHAYVVDKLDLEQAAARTGIPHATARKWKAAASAAADDWDKARAAHSLTSSGAGTIAQLVLHDFLAMYQSTVDAVRDDITLPAMQRAETLSRLADAFQKTMSAVAKAAPDLGRFAVATELLSDLAEFVAREFPDHRAGLLEILEPFGAFVAKKYG